MSGLLCPVPFLNALSPYLQGQPAQEIPSLFRCLLSSNDLSVFGLGLSLGARIKTAFPSSQPPFLSSSKHQPR